jgi:hypothetical protein
MSFELASWLTGLSLDRNFATALVQANEGAIENRFGLRVVSTLLNAVIVVALVAILTNCVNVARNQVHVNTAHQKILVLRRVFQFLNKVLQVKINVVVRHVATVEILWSEFATKVFFCLIIIAERKDRLRVNLITKFTDLKWVIDHIRILFELDSDDPGLHQFLFGLLSLYLLNTEFEHFKEHFLAKIENF